MSVEAIKPTHKAIEKYYATLAEQAAQGVAHEMAVRSAFQNLLADTARARGWTFIPELSKQAAGPGRAAIRPDGTIRDENRFPRGYWEAKDSGDSLDAEIARKKAKGYPLNNIIFEDTREAVLYQNKNEMLRVELKDAQRLADLLNEFYRHSEPQYERYELAVAEFKTRIPELARGLEDLIKEAHEGNKRFERVQ